MKRRRSKPASYVLDSQVGFVLRQVLQRHATIFVAQMGEDLTMTQWAALSKLYELGPCSQNLLGRYTAMDAATIKGPSRATTPAAAYGSRPAPGRH